MASELKVDNISEKTANAGVQLSSSLGFVSKTTSQINALSGMAAGDTVYDSDMGTLKVYNGDSWNEMSSSTHTIDIDYLVVAGGGGSGVDQPTLGYTGGSGAGGLLSSKDTQGRGVAAATTPAFTSGTQITVTVGAGGPSESKGSPSTFYNVTALGGGIPADSNADTAGGCGAGASSSSIDDTDIGGVGSHGYDGGDNNGNKSATAGGGGAGGEGLPGVGGTGGNGGVGAVTTILSSSTATTVGVGEISGSTVYFSGGGAGAPNGTGGLGGGADGGGNDSGDAKTGGGCGGTYHTTVSGAGGSGVVIMRYPATHTLTNIDSGLTSATYTESNEKVTVFTAGTGTVTI